MFRQRNCLNKQIKVFLVHGSHLEERIFAGTKWLGKYQVQASRFMAHVIVLVITNAMISNDWKKLG